MAGKSKPKWAKSRFVAYIGGGAAGKSKPKLVKSRFLAYRSFNAADFKVQAKVVIY